MSADHNFQIYANGLKSDGGGHNKEHYNNLDAYVGICLCHCDSLPYAPGYADSYYNNTCVQAGPAYGPGIPYANLGPCNVSHFELATVPQMHSNRIYVPSGKPQIACGAAMLSLEQWQNMGNDKGTVGREPPAPATVIQWAKDLLWHGD